MSAAVPEHLRAPASAERRFALGASVVAFAALLLFSWPTLTSLHVRWVDYGYSHGYLILALAGWLAYRAVHHQPMTSGQPSPAGSLLLVAVAGGILIAEAGTTVGLAQLLLPVLWFGGIWALLGWPNAKRFLLPVGYVYFAVPVWDAINGTLQSLTVAVVSAWLRWAEIPAFIDGNFIHIPAGSFEVAGGCSGLHYVLVGLSLGTYLAFARYRRWQSGVLLVALAIVTALLANWVRVFSVVIAGHVTDMQHFLITHDHYYFGWALFLVLGTLPLMVVDWRTATGVRAASAGLPPARPSTPAKWAGSVGVALVCVGLVLLQSRVLGGGVADPGEALEPIRVVGWSSVGVWDDNTTPVFVGTGEAVTGRFVDEDDSVDLYLATYARQGHGGEVVNDANRPEGVVDRVEVSRVTSASGQNGLAITLLELELAGSNRLIWFGRRIGGRWASSDMAAKFYQILGALGGRHEALVIVASTDCAETCVAARARLTRFTGALSPAMFGADR